jgi:hypothetical protein
VVVVVVVVVVEVGVALPSVTEQQKDSLAV